MATYRITAPDGSEYEVTPPDGVGPDEVMRQVQGQFQERPQEPADPYVKMSLDQLRGEYRRQQKLGNSAALPKIADAFVRKEANEGGFGLAVDDVIRQAAKGVPIIGGAADEVNAGIAYATGQSPTYEEALDYNRARDRYREELNPTSSTLVQLAGGVGGTLAGARSLGIGYGVNATRPLLQRALIGSGAGAGVGAADFFARGEGGAANRSVDAVLGAGFGGVIGAAAPVVAQGLSSAAQRVADFLTSDAALRRLGISREAANVLIRQLSTDDTLSATGAARIRQGGPDAMLADAGPSATNLLDTALERSGPGATAAREAIEQRAANAGQQMRGTLDATFGAPVGVETRQAGIRQATAGARRTAYELAEDQGVDFSTPAGQELERLMGRIPEWAFREAREEMALRGEQETVVRLLDRATRALNSAAQRGERGGAMRGQTPLGDATGQLARDIRQQLRLAVPEYARALDTAADPIRRIQATEFGARLLDKSTTREEVARELAGMPGGERQAVMNGIRDQIDEVMANVRAMASDPNIEARQLRETLNALSSEAARQKITYVIGEASARRFFGEVHRLSRALELRASVARNSRTFGRTSTAAQVDAQLEPGIIGTALEGRPMEALKKVIQAMTGMTPERRLAMEDRLYGEIARALTEVRGTRAEGYLNELLRAVRMRSMNRNAGRELGRAGADVLIGAAPTPADRALTPAR